MHDDTQDDERALGLQPGASNAGRRPNPFIAPVGDPSIDPGDGAGVPPVLVPPHENTKQALRVVLGERCAEARRRLKFTQRGLAKHLDMSPSWVREYEGGSQFAPSWLIVALAEAARLPVCWFYGYRGGCQ